MDWQVIGNSINWQALGLLVIVILCFRAISILVAIIRTLEGIHTILTNMSERWNEKVRASEDLAERKLRLQRDRDAGLSDR
jgi:hypothetical protein